MSGQPVAGIHAVQSVLQSAPDSVEDLLLAREDTRAQTLLALARACAISVSSVPMRELDRRFPGLRHQGAVAICRGREPLSEPQMLAQLAGLRRPGLVLVLDGVTDPHNLGAVLRTADAAGADAVLCPRAGSASITPVVRKVASGAADSVAFCQVANLARTLTELKELGYWLYGAADGADSLYTAQDYRGPVALLLGSEGSGLRRLTRNHCDALIGIPMAGRVSSLNVSVAAGICLFEVVRQRSIAV